MQRLLILLFLPVSLASAQTLDPASRAGYASIDTVDLWRHLAVLASDSLEGRETTYPGQKKAAAYIAGVFKKLHLEPVADSGTYFQHFFVNLTYVDPRATITANIRSAHRQFHWGKDFTAEASRDTTISGSAAFVGFSDSEIDSTAKTKLAGRIVLAFMGTREDANDSSREMLFRRLHSMPQDLKAAAILIVADEEGEGSFFNAIRAVRTLKPNAQIMRLKDGAPQRTPGRGRLFVSSEMAEEILRPSGIPLAELRKKALDRAAFDPVMLDDDTLTVAIKVVKETRQTENVIGMLPGSDEQLKNQAVVISAHYDHLGKDALGRIYHGADDDGSGTSTVLELAEAFGKNPSKPKRSVLFLLNVGEEEGLLGSRYYVSHPVVPLQQTVADLNIDMIGRVDPVHEAAHEINYVYVIGSDKISAELDNLLRVADVESEDLTLNYKYDAEDDPEQLYRRSDHYNFARHKIPVVFFFTGLHADYHQPTDTIDKILFGRMARIARVIYDLGWKIANLEHPLIKKTGE
jgi:hypothetical protein